MVNRYALTIMLLIMVSRHAADDGQSIVQW
jgi:hypothetical protein